MKNILKRLIIQILVYLVIFYLVPYISINFLSENIRDIITALFLVVFNILILVSIAAIDTYKNKLNWFLWIIPALLFIPTINIFFGGMDLILYSILYALSYGIGMLLGWSYKTYGYQLQPGYGKVYAEQKRKESKEKKEKKEKKKKNSSKKGSNL